MSGSPATLLRLIPRDYGCPAWCERTDHDADMIGPADPPRHYGPDFGLIHTESVGAEAPHALLSDYDGGAQIRLSVDDLVDMAAKAIEAAVWLGQGRGLSA